MRLGILTSHPIQYQAPWFRALAKEADLEVFFAHRQSAAEQGKAGFGVAFDWDVDLLAGYAHRFLANVAACPDVSTYSGCNTPEIAEILARNAAGFDAFIVTGWYLKSYLQAARACRTGGVPVMVRGDSQLCTPRSLLKKLAMEVRQRWLLRRFDGFLSVGQRHREYLRHYGVAETKIFHVPHIVDNEWFERIAGPTRQRRTVMRQEWEAEECDLVALFVGKFISKKRPADLLRAMSILRRSTPGFGIVGVYIGAGEMETELRQIAAREGLRAYFPGFKNQSELPISYAAADVLVLPSDGAETWGLVVNEAMACGLPAIVSNAVGCGPDLIDEGKTGFTFRVGDTTHLASKLKMYGEMKRAGHDFTSALAAKMRFYNLATAVRGTLQAAHELSRSRHG